MATSRGAYFRLSQDPQNEIAHSANVGPGTGSLRTRSGTLISTLIRENFLGEHFENYNTYVSNQHKFPIVVGE